MDQNDMQKALDTLMKTRETLLENMVEEVMRNQEEDPFSFNLQDIEDRFAMRLGNLNTMILTLQDQMGNYDMGGGTRVVTNVYETSRNKLQNKLEELVAFIPAEDILHLSVVPSSGGKYLIVVANAEGQ